MCGHPRSIAQDPKGEWLFFIFFYSVEKYLAQCMQFTGIPIQSEKKFSFFKFSIAVVKPNFTCSLGRLGVVRNMISTNPD